MLLTELFIIFICLAAGGLLKGATGAGAPVLAVPALVMFFDVKTAIIILLLPNVVTNGWQACTYWQYMPGGLFLKLFLVGGVAGVAAGTWALTQLSADTLQICVAVIVLIYIVFRVVHPHWQLGERLGVTLAFPVGIGSGILQGATGISAPLSLTYLNAMRFERKTFIPVASALFLLFVVIQIPALSYSGLLTTKLMAISLAAVFPVCLTMPLGVKLAKRLPAVLFDRIILVLLGVMALKLLVDSVL